MAKDARTNHTKLQQPLKTKKQRSRLLQPKAALQKCNAAFVLWLCCLWFQVQVAELICFPGGNANYAKGNKTTQHY